MIYDSDSEEENNLRDELSDEDWDEDLADFNLADYDAKDDDEMEVDDNVNE